MAERRAAEVSECKAGCAAGPGWLGWGFQGQLELPGRQEEAASRHTIRASLTFGIHSALCCTTGLDWGS